MWKQTLLGALLALVVLIQMSTCVIPRQGVNEHEKEETRKINQENTTEPKKVPNSATEEKPKNAANPQSGVTDSAKEKKETDNAQTGVDRRELPNVEGNGQPQVYAFDRRHERNGAMVTNIREEDSSQSDEEPKAPPQPHHDYSYNLLKGGYEGHHHSPFPSRSCPPHIRCTEAPSGFYCLQYAKNDRASSTVNALLDISCCPVFSCRREDGSKFFHFGIEIEDFSSLPPTSSYSSLFRNDDPSASSRNSESYGNTGNPSAFGSQSKHPGSIYYPRSRIFSEHNEPPFSQAPSQARFGSRAFRYRTGNAPGANTNRKDKRNNMGPASESRPGVKDPGFVPQFEGAEALYQQRNNKFSPGRSPVTDLFSPGENPENDFDEPSDPRAAAAGSRSFLGVGRRSRFPMFDELSRMRRKDDVGGEPSEMNSDFHSGSDGVISGAPSYGFMREHE